MGIYNNSQLLYRYLIEPVREFFYTKLIFYLQRNGLKLISADICISYHNKYVLSDDDRIITTKMFLKSFKENDDLSYIVPEAWIPIRDDFYKTMIQILEEYELNLYNDMFIVDDITV